MKYYDHAVQGGRGRFDRSGGALLVERAGYVDKVTQLQILATSGAALEEYRRKMYPHFASDPETTEPVFDPTIQKGFDFFDCADRVKVVKANMARKLEELKLEEHYARQAAEDAAKKPSDEESSAAAKSV